MSVNKLASNILKVSEDIKNGQALKDFMKKEGKKLRNKTLKKAREKVEPLTGNYHDSIKNGRVWSNGGNISINVYADADKAPHAHLIEKGHILTKKNKETGEIKELGHVKGKYVFEEALEEHEDEFLEGVERLSDGIIEEIIK